MESEAQASEATLGLPPVWYGNGMASPNLDKN